MAVQGVPAWRRGCGGVVLLVVVLCVIATVPASSAAARTAALGSGAVGVHSMLYLNTPVAAKEIMFREAAAVGAGVIRLDVELSGVFANPSGPPDWSGVDQYMRLARRYRLRVLADLTATPWYLADCPTTTAPVVAYWTCPPRDPAWWGREAAQIAAHTHGVIDDFEVINEPDGAWAFLGTPQQYAAILADAYDSIHAADPQAQVALGGLMDTAPAGEAWMNALLATPGADAVHKFDIANIHIRTPNPSDTGAVVRRWRRYLADKGFRGPLWVTETGYPADPAFQTQPGYQDGPRSQAQWLTTAIPSMLQCGAKMVFVTERDSMRGAYASEGILQSTDPLTGSPLITPRPSFYAVQALVDSLRRTPAHQTRETHQTRVGRHRPRSL